MAPVIQTFDQKGKKGRLIAGYAPINVNPVGGGGGGGQGGGI